MSESHLAQTLAALDPKKRELLALLARKGGIDLSRTPIVPVPRDAASYPLSFAQERLWFLDQLAPGNSAWNLPIAVRIRTALDPVVLARAFTEIARRHETLRTTFSMDGEEAVQNIAPPGPVTVPLVDLSGLAEPEEEVRRLAAEEAWAPFDLAQGPLLRVRLLRLGPDEQVLLVTMHHIVSDAWSMNLLVEEVAALYGAFSQGLPSPLPELPVQYIDFAQWQRQALEGQTLASQLAWWRDSLGEVPPVLELATDRPRPPVLDQRGVRATGAVSPEILERLKAQGLAEDATLFMVLMAAFQALLHRITGQTGFAVGTPVAGRKRVEAERLIGFFVNSLPVRADLAGDPAFGELLSRVREAAVGAFEHQDVPFERLVEELHPERDLSRTPLFQVMLAFQNVPGPSSQGPALPLEAVPFGDVGAMYDLTLTAAETGDGLFLALDGSAGLFERTTVQRMLGHLQALLADASADRRLSDLALLSEAEEQQVRVEWNDTIRETRTLPVHQSVAAWAARTPGATAVAMNGRSLTYAELYQQATALAQRLRGMGIGPESVVAIRMDRSPEMVCSLLAVLLAGAAYLPLDPGTPDERVAVILEDAKAATVLTDFEAGPESQTLETDLDPRSLAYVIYTSGSTGMPKGVEITHAGLANLIGWHLETYQVRPGDRATQLAGLGFDASVWEIWPYLAAGAELHLVPNEVSLDPEALADLLIRERITHAFIPTPIAEALLASPASPLSRLGGGRWERGPGGEVLLLTGGDRLHRGPALGLPIRLINHYGPTESTVVTTAGPVDPGAVNPPIGRPIANLRVDLLDRSLRPVPIGVPGELYAGGAGLARGYRGRPDLTAERFLPDPFAGPEEAGGRLYATGDLARRRPDGAIEFLGRADEQVKIRGVRIEPGEIEAALASHPAVREAAVLAREAAPGDRRLVAYVVPESPDARPETLRAFLKERLPEPMVPSAWVLLDRMPLTPNGKVDRRALAHLEPIETVDRHEHVAPRTPAEDTIAGLFAALLGVEKVGAHDDFFALGGHSLLASRLAARLRESFGVPLPLRQLFESPTPAGLAGLLEEPAATVAPPPLRPAPPGEERPLSFAQQRLWFLDRMDPGTAAYNVPLAVELTGDLRPAVLEATLGEIERRHEVLRTTFPAVDGRATQVVHPPLRRPLPLIDLSGLAAGEWNAEARRLATEESARPFNLETGPLWRAVLVLQNLPPLPGEGRAMGEGGRGGEVFLLTFHHIVADGWSMGVLLRELGTLYPTIAAGRSSPLPELPVQYADFAAWQRRWLQGEVLEAQLNYWRHQLAGDLAPLDLPADHPRPPVQTWRGASVPFSLGPEETDGLRALAQRSGATLFMTLLATFQVLLHRLTGREDVIAGSPVAGLGSAEAEPLIGLFTNMLVLRTDLSGSPAFAEALRRVREVTLGALVHQDLPFERLVEELKPERDLSRPPLFQVMFALQNTPRTGLDLPGLALRPLDVGTGAARYDLTLDLIEGTEGIGGRFEYNADLFDPPTVQRWALQLRTLIAGLLADPARPVADLPLETHAERHQRLLEWNDTVAPWPEAATIHRLVEEQSERTPGVEAVIAGIKRLTYRELLDRSRQLAEHLRALGIGPESRVGISLHRSADLVIALLGVLRTGAAYVPLDPTWPAERLAWLAEDAGLEAVVVEARTAGRFPGLPEVIASPPLSRGKGGRWERGPGGEALAYLLYTSGSTGRPKGVAVTHRNVLNFFAGMDAALLRESAGTSPGGTSPGTWLAVTSVSFDISVLELLWTLARGFTVVIHPDRPIAAAAPAAPREIDFSLFYFAAAESRADDPYRLLLEGAKLADARGFTAVWTPERHFHPFGGLYPNPAVTGAAIAAVTERVQIRAGSVVLPLHNPIRVAEEWSLVDSLSHGRVGISFASGWHANDFVLAPESYEDRRDTMLRGIDTVRRLWRGESVRVPDGAGRPVDISILPRPVQRELPVWVTAAGSPETFRAAGEVGANLLTHLLGQTLEELAEKIAAYRETRRRCDGRPGTVSLMLHTYVGEDLDEVRETVRAPMKRYLRSSLSLLRDLARTRGTDLETLGEDEMDALLEHAFERYFENAGLLGTPETCLGIIARLAEIGVDEVACLIDFGVETGRVLASLERLDEVRRRSRPRQENPPDEAEEEVTIAEQIRRHGVTHLQCTPTMAGMLAADPESLAALGSLRMLLLGGEALPPALLEKLPRLPGGVRNMYGPTETTVWSATWTGEEPGTVGGAAPVGRPITNTAIHVVDLELRPVPAGCLGELVIGGAGVARGYLGRPELTAERFVPDLFSAAPGARLYRTGDLGRQLSDGTLEYRGRLDQQVKVRGVRIEPGEVEEALRLHPAVADCAVAVRRAAEEDRLIAWLVPRDGANPSTGDLRAFLLERLPEPMVPSAFVPLERLPLTPNGKLDRRALPAPEPGRPATGAAWVAPRNEIERKIAAVWQEVLQAERVGVQDNFFELGGTSLGVAQVHSRLRAVLGRDLSMVDLFRHPTVGALARHLTASEGTDEPSASIDQRIQARLTARERRRAR